MGYVSVKYKRPDINAFAGRAYTYYTELPLEVGDKVVCVTPNGDTPAIVVDVELEEPTFKCKEITEYWEDDKNEHSGL